MEANEFRQMKQRPVTERPYERCLKLGEQSLTDAELLSVILRSGTYGRSALELAQDILLLCDQNLEGIYHLSIHDFMQIQGIGEVKAIQIKAIGELSKRIVRGHTRDQIDFRSPETVAGYYMETLRHEEQELLLCMMLDTKNRILKEAEIFRGTVNASLVSPREVFLEALKFHAVNLILIHNHPSGDPQPSHEDLLVTSRIAEAGELLNIHLLDHIIIGNQCYVSFCERNLLPPPSD